MLQIWHLFTYLLVFVWIARHFFKVALFAHQTIAPPPPSCRKWRLWRATIALILTKITSVQSRSLDTVNVIASSSSCSTMKEIERAKVSFSKFQFTAGTYLVISLTFIWYIIENLWESSLFIYLSKLFFSATAKDLNEKLRCKKIYDFPYLHNGLTRFNRKWYKV